VWTGDRKKYFPFRPDFYSSQPVLLAGADLKHEYGVSSSQPEPSSQLRCECCCACCVLFQVHGTIGHKMFRCPLMPRLEKQALCWN